MAESRCWCSGPSAGRAQAVSQIMGTRVRDGVTEFLVNWSCSWTDWQPFLDEEAKAKADEEAKPKEGAKTKPTKAVKRGAEDAGADVRRSARNQSKE